MHAGLVFMEAKVKKHPHLGGSRNNIELIQL